MATVKMANMVGILLAGTLVGVIASALWLAGAFVIAIAIANSAGWTDFSADFRTAFALALVLRIWELPTIIFKSISEHAES